MTAAVAEPPGDRGAAIVVGVGSSAGLGASVARRFAREGLIVGVFGRTTERLEKVRSEIEAAGGRAVVLTGDATSPQDMERAFAAMATSGPLKVAVFNAGGNRPRAFLETDPAFFEEMWRVCCFAGHLFALEAAKLMLPGGGTILFTGASASLRGRAGFVAFAAAKAGLRAVAQSMARAFGPQGLHVAHIVIDGGIDGERIHRALPQLKAERGEDGLLGLEAIAESYWQLHVQHRSAWSHEIDLRPFREPF